MSETSPASMGEREPLRVVLAGDDELVRAGLATMLAPLADRTLFIDDASNGKPADITLVDPFGPAGPGLDVVRDLTARDRAPCVAVYTYRHDPALVEAALAAGAAGYLSKASSASDLANDLERLAAGERVVPAAVPDDDELPELRRWALTEREAEVATLLARGLRNADIAGAMGISLNTVKTHLRALFRKLDVATRAQAVIRVLGAQRGYVGQPPPEPPRQ